MSKDKKRYSTADLAHFADSLRIVAARIEQATDMMRQQNLETLDVAAWKSGELGVKNFVAFARSMHEALDEYLLQQPLASGHLLPKVENTNRKNKS